jgi:hypothetical protein
MNDHDLDFVTSLLGTPVLSETLELVGDPSIDGLRSILLRARQKYLSALLRAQDPPREDLVKELANLSNIAFVLEELSVDVLSERGSTQDADIFSALELAGLIFEYVGDFVPERHSSVEPYNWYLHSAVCYSLGHYEANSTVLTRRVLRKVKSGLDASPEECIFDRFRSLTHFGVLMLLSRAVREARAQADAATELAPKVLAHLAGDGNTTDDAHLPPIASVAGFRELASFVYEGAGYLLEGNEPEIDNAFAHLERAISWFAGAEMSFEAWLGDRLEFIFEQMVERSIWRTLSKLEEKRPQYLEALISKEEGAVVELWSSQIAALKQVSESGVDCGVLSDEQRCHVVSMPAGAGKTRIAEIVIVDTVDLETHDTCVYVAPTRALVSQVAADLDETLAGAGYRIATAVGTYESVPGLDEVLVEDCDVLVTTPEKLDMLVRVGALAVQRATLFVFDECHKVEDAGRGLRLELLISRLLTVCENARFVLLSAVLPHSNLGEFVDWVASGEPLEFHWRPTRLLEAVVTR